MHAATEESQRTDDGQSEGKQDPVLINKIKDVGEWLFNYYLFVRWYHREPIDLLDLFNGLDCVPIFMKIEPHL